MSQQQRGVIALLLCLVVWLAWQDRNLSHGPQPSISQSAPTQEQHQTNFDSIEERHQATEEAIAYYNKWLMFFTAILAVATLGLGIATVGLYLASERQLRLARNEFVSTHRPRLVVRGVSFVDDNAMKVGSRARVQIPLVNQGETGATGLTVFLYQRDGEVIAFGPPDPAASGTG